jgi:hypothetical protein
LRYRSALEIDPAPLSSVAAARLWAWPVVTRIL